MTFFLFYTLLELPRFLVMNLFTIKIYLNVFQHVLLICYLLLMSSIVFVFCQQLPFVKALDERVLK